MIHSIALQKRNQLRDLHLDQPKDLQLDPVSCSDTFLLKIINTEIMNLLLWFPHRRKLLEITNIMSVWMSFLNCAVKKKIMDPMTELLWQVGSLFSCGGLVPVLSGCTGIIFRFYSRKYLKETRNVIQFCRYFSMSIKTWIPFLVFFHFSEKDSKPHQFFINFYIFLGIFSLIFLYNSLNTNF